jgi:hypothetical protein
MHLIKSFLTSPFSSLWCGLKVFLLLACILSNQAISAQQNVFERIYPLGFSETIQTLIQTNDSSFVLAGVQHIGIADFRAVIIGTNKNGIQQYSKTIGNSGGLTEITDGILQNDSVLVFTGSSIDYGSSFQLVVWKLDLNGDSISTWHYGGVQDEEFGMGICQAGNNGFVVCGGVVDVNSGNQTNVLVVRFDSLGNPLWNRSFGGSQVDVAWAVKPTADDGFIVTGFSTSNFASNGPTAFLWKLDSLGQTQWLRYYGQESYFGYGYDVVQKPDGGYIFGGITGHYEPNNNLWRNVPYLVSTNAQGDTLWTWRNGFPREGTINSVVIKGDEIWAAGDWLFRENFDRQMLLFRFSESGQSLGYSNYGGLLSEEGRHVVKTFDGGFAIAGSNTSINTFKSSYLVKTDSNGCVQPGCIQTVSVQEHLQANIALKIYPNPVVDQLNIASNFDQGQLQLQISDMQGRMVHSEQQPANSEIQLQLSHLPAGMYLLRIQNGQQSAWARFVKQ